MMALANNNVPSASAVSYTALAGSLQFNAAGNRYLSMSPGMTLGGGGGGMTLIPYHL